MKLSTLKLAAVTRSVRFHCDLKTSHVLGVCVSVSLIFASRNYSAKVENYLAPWVLVPSDT